MNLPAIRDIYRFASLCPHLRGVGNEALLGPMTLGIEVTVPALAARCGLRNIDPQHTGGDPQHAAIEVCLEAPLPPDGATLVTIRPDLDSVGGWRRWRCGVSVSCSTR